MSKITKDSSWPTSFVALVALGVIAYNDIHWNSSSIANTKPYDDIASFYPHYLDEHRDPMNQRLHVIGSSIIAVIALSKPEILITGMIGFLSGYIAFPIFRGVSHGMFEALVMVSVMVTFSHLHGIKKYAVLVTIIGYGCAWVGHFYFEENKPATFIYPSYSLICDWKMFGSFYKQLLTANDWDMIWEKGIDINEAIKNEL